MNQIAMASILGTIGGTLIGIHTDSISTTFFGVVCIFVAGMETQRGLDDE